jgi:tetratricopeptide (TPR) repeat protein
MKNSRLMILIAILIFPSIASAQTEGNLYYPKLLQVEPAVAKTNLAKIINEMGNQNHPRLIHIEGMGNPKSVIVLDDRIEITINPRNLTINFSDLLKYKIGIVHKLPTYSTHEIKLGDVMFWTYTAYNDQLFKDLADYLFYFQHQYRVKQHDAQLGLFKPLAAEYCTLKVKPPVSEEQRKFIVQANSLNQQKMFDKAIEFYIKAIELDPTAYPAAYSNLALLSAQVHNFDDAIYYMKKYLLLEPGAADARSSQDKVYEWEVMLIK